MVDEGDICLGLGQFVDAYKAYAEALTLSDISGLGLHSQIAKSRLAEHGTLFEETQELDIEAVISSAYDEVAALEAKWKAPPQPKTENQTLH